jgi:hypothetical protein
LLTCEHQQALAAAIPASRLLVYQDTGHLVLWEQPGRLASDVTASSKASPRGPPEAPQLGASPALTNPHPPPSVPAATGNLDIRRRAGVRQLGMILPQDVGQGR